MKHAILSAIMNYRHVVQHTSNNFFVFSLYREVFRFSIDLFVAMLPTSKYIVCYLCIAISFFACSVLCELFLFSSSIAPTKRGIPFIVCSLVVLLHQTKRLFVLAPGQKEYYVILGGGQSHKIVS